jgi:uncharacterized protein (DUF952 family)
MTLIYKICDTAMWREAEKLGVFTGAEIDIQDGYIHFSTAAQLAETARKHFHGRKDLVLVTIDSTALDIKWEPSRGGDLFPHLYTDLPVDAAVSVTAMPCDADGMPVPEGGFPAV